MWRTEGHSENGPQSVGMIHVTFAGGRVKDVLYYSVCGESVCGGKQGKIRHKSSPDSGLNLNGD